MSTSDDYPKFGKIPRLHKPVVITEMIDGTNGLIYIREEDGSPVLPGETRVFVEKPGVGATGFIVRAGSRNRWLTPEQDNYGFAKWVQENATQLVDLGVGCHYGEWFGKGIQRGYGLEEKGFALFNVARWYDPEVESESPVVMDFPNAQPCPPCCTVVPVMTVQDASRLNVAVMASFAFLRENGSVVASGFSNPEGVVVYHLAAGQYFKVLLENDDVPKSAVNTVAGDILRSAV